MRNLLSIILLFVVGSLWGQNKEASTAEKSVFWKVSSADGQHTSYLFGTIHLISKDKFVLPETVTDKLKSADKLYLELDDLTDQTAIMKLALLEEGKMTDMFTQVEKDSVYAYVKDAFGMDSTAYESIYGKFKPFFFAQFSMMKFMINSESYDRTFSNLAKANDITIAGLETMEQQISFFDNMPIELQKETVLSVVRNPDNAEADWIKMQDAYLFQDIEQIVALDESSPKMTAYMEIFLMKNRNEKWVETLTKGLNKENAFIGVGAAHLVGEFGLVNLLKEQGFILEPIEIQLTK